VASGYLRQVNHLAHIVLSGDDEGLILGNFIADFVKGRDFEKYTDNVKRGILMHRAIDTFTDAHPVFRTSTARVRPQLRKFAGMAVDVYYDHFLAKSWAERKTSKLPDFTQNIYSLLSKHTDNMPEGALRFYQYMISNKILEGYAELEVLHRVFYGMSRRTRFKSNLEDAGVLLEMNYAGLNEDFSAFFPELETYCVQWLNQHHD
jgi:acyl carrier protein phosphodiesterase